MKKSFSLSFFKSPRNQFPRSALVLLILTSLVPSVSAQRFDEPYSVRTTAGVAGVAGSADGTGTAARFNSPYGVARDGAGNLFIADTFNFTIRKMTPAGVVTTVAGLAGMPGSSNGVGTEARFQTPYDVAVDSAGNLFVADSENHTIRKITPAGLVTTFAGLAGFPGSADGMGSAARFNLPNSLTVDGVGNVYVADTFNHTIRKITPDGLVSTVAGTVGVTGTSDGMGSTARFSHPFGIAADANGQVYVADTFNHTIRKLATDSTVSTLAGAPTFWGTQDGVGYYGRFLSPRGVAVDGAGNVYVADEGNHLIRKVTRGRGCEHSCRRARGFRECRWKRCCSPL